MYHKHYINPMSRSLSNACLFVVRLKLTLKRKDCLGSFYDLGCSIEQYQMAADTPLLLAASVLNHFLRIKLRDVHVGALKNDWCGQTNLLVGMANVPEAWLKRLEPMICNSTDRTSAHAFHKVCMVLFCNTNSAIRTLSVTRL